jgi:hypothetical protein
MVLPLETIARGASPICSDCGVAVKLGVHSSPAGFYIGSYCDCGPYSRESGYYRTREQAEKVLKKGGFER